MLVYYIFNHLTTCPLKFAGYGLLTLIGIYFAKWIIFRINYKNFPNGPLGLPIFGYLPYLLSKPHNIFKELNKKYGCLYSLYLGRKRVIVASDLASVKEVLENPEFLGRPDMSPMQCIKRKTISIVNGREWREQKNFISYLLRDIGLGKCFMEAHVNDEIMDFIQILDKEEGKACDVDNLLLSSTCNVITALVFGRRLPHNDPKRKTLDNSLKNIYSIFGRTAALSFTPWLTKIFIRFGLFNFQKAKDATLEIHKLIKAEIEEHKKFLDPHKRKDFINGFLLEMEKENAESSFTEEMLLGNIQTLYKVGTETIRIAIAWSLLTMAHYQEVQKKVQKEIDSVIGKDSFPSWTNHWKTPYTVSVMMEIQRWKTTVPFNLLRYALKDTTLQGYQIPEGTNILIDLWSVHNDDAHWKNPNKFFPERFLNKETDYVKNEDAFMPFSIGKRSCPAKSLAKVELYLYFTYILQRYKVSFPEGFSHDLDGITGLFYRPKPYKLCFTRR
ncbi:cytochrome P450 2J1-like [Centruroides vittatus]|uniref:cytochrome P450 2J1-like n=1 Tax=Centruroides vittatus TaxID=120091 RepID=UPI00350F2B05